MTPTDNLHAALLGLTCAFLLAGAVGAAAWVASQPWPEMPVPLDAVPMGGF